MATQLTKHFTLEEMNCHCPACANKKPSPKIIANLKALANHLELLRAAVGKPIILNCAYRCPAHNKQCKGAAKNSFHMAGYAADLRIPEGYTVESFFKFATGIPVSSIPSRPKGKFGFTGAGCYKGFIHVDVAPFKPRPNTWKK